MKPRIGMLMALTACWTAAPLAAQEEVSAAQNKLLSQRAAQADAYRKLAECIKGLQINSTTYVRDFVAESDTIQASMDEFIRGVRLGPGKWYEDLTCEVPAEVTVASVIQTLREIHTRHYKGDRIKGADFVDMETKIEKKNIKVVGMGAPRPDLPPELPQGVASQIGAGTALPEPSIPALWKNMPPNARLMAARAAEIDAKRQLLERIKGLRITSDTLVRDFVAESDQINTQAWGTVVGAQTVRTYYHSDEPIVEVTVEVPVETVVTIIKELHTRSIRGDRVKGTDLTDITRSIQSKTFQATGMGVPPPDALVQYNTKVETQERIPDWASMKIEMTGSGVAPADAGSEAQGRLMAARAAELDAKRKLGEHINGLLISSDTTVRDFVTQNDVITTQMDAMLVGSMVEKTEFENGMAKVTVSIPGMQVWQIVHERLLVIRRAG